MARWRGAIYDPPSALAAHCLGPLDSVPRRLTTFGAAFLALRAGRAARSVLQHPARPDFWTPPAPPSETGGHRADADQ